MAHLILFRPFVDDWLQTKLARKTKEEEEKGETLSVRMPQSRALESVRSAASARRAAIRRQTSSTVVLSGTVSARDSRSRFTVRSPPMVLHAFIPFMVMAEIDRSGCSIAQGERITCLRGRTMRTWTGRARAWGCRWRWRQRPRGAPWHRRSPWTASAGAVTGRRPLLRAGEHQVWGTGRDTGALGAPN